MATKIFLNTNKLQITPGAILHSVRIRRDLDPEYIKLTGEESPKYTPISDSLYTYNEVAGIINLIRAYPKVEVDFTASPFAQRDQFGQLISKEEVNEAAKNNQPYGTNILEEQQTNKISNDGATIGNYNETNGFKSLTPFARENETITKRPMPVIFTASAGDGSLLPTTTNTSDLTDVFGFSPTGTTTLKKVVTSGSPASLLKQLQKNFANLPPQRIRTYASNVSISPSRTIESLKPENNPSLVSVQTSSKIYKDKLKDKLNSAGLDLSPLTAFSGLGRSKQNLGAQFIGNLLNKVGSLFGSIKGGIGAFAGAALDLIETGGGQTNISSYVNKGSLVDVPAPKISYVLQDQNAFLGYATPDTYDFTFVSSVEELITEFKSSRRGPKNTEDDFIGGLFIYEPRKYTGPPEKANAKGINEIVKKSQLAALTKEIRDTNTAADGKTAAETALDRISLNPNNYGLNSHYIILTDGSLQRGRPLDKVRSSESYPRFYKTGVQLTILSGGSPPNNKQFETYDRFLKAWFAVFPDCGVYSSNDADALSQNTFDVKQNIKSKYRFVYRYDDLTNLNEFPSKLQTAITKPATIAKTSSSITKPVSYAEANKTITNLAESKRFNNDINGMFKKAGAAIGSLNGESRTALSSKFGAENLPDGDVKAQFDADYKAAQAKMKENNKLLNNIINKVNTDINSVKTFSSTLNQNRGK